MANDSLFLSASEVKDLTGWPDVMVNDYISRVSLYMLTGSGSPEGVEPSNASRLYLDTDNNDIWVNPEVGVKTGWVPV